jgi:hypothetical protein
MERFMELIASSKWLVTTVSLALLLGITEGGRAWCQAKIDKATIYKQIDTGTSLGFVIRVEGTSLISPEIPRVLLLPLLG